MAMTRYLFGDLTTNDVIAEIPLQSVSFDRQLNDWGNFRGTLYLSQSGLPDDLVVQATTPGKCFVVVELDDVPVWDGVVWTRVYDSQAKDMNLTARTYEGYIEKQFVGDFARVAVEQQQIAADLLNDMQGNSSRDIGLVIPSGFVTTTPRDLTVLSSDYKNYLEVIGSVADGVDGFDWTIDTTRDPVSQEYVRTVRFGNTELGTTDGAPLSFDYPGNVTNYWRTDGMTNAATNLFLLGSGEGSDMLVGTATQDDLITNGFKRYDVTVSRKDINNQGLLNSMATQLGKQRRPPYTTIKFNVKADLDPIFGSYGLGDTCTIAIVDPRHPGGFTKTARIIAWTYSPESDDTVAEAEIVFEGDDLNE
jgi:hypothetical protein